MEHILWLFNDFTVFSFHFIFLVSVRSTSKSYWPVWTARKDYSCCDRSHLISSLIRLPTGTWFAVVDLSDINYRLNSPVESKMCVHFTVYSIFIHCLQKKQTKFSFWNSLIRAYEDREQTSSKMNVTSGWHIASTSCAFGFFVAVVTWKSRGGLD